MSLNKFLLAKIEDGLNPIAPADVRDLNELRREIVRLEEDVKFYKSQTLAADRLRDPVIDTLDKTLVDPAISLNLLALFLDNEKVTTEMLMELKSENISYQLELLELNGFVKKTNKGWVWK